MALFEFINPSASSYFIMETVRNNQGFYNGSSLKAASGSLNIVSNIPSTGVVQSDYIWGTVVPPGSSSLAFTASADIPTGSVYFRGTGEFTVTITTDSTPSFDADAQLFITNAAITDSTQQTAVNNLVVDLKGYGIWTKMKALYPFVGGTASQHKFNLKDPRDLDSAFRLVFNGGITHSSTGVKGNGTNAYYQTFINVANTFSPATGGSMFTYIRNNISGGVDLGAYSTAVFRMNLVSRYSDNTFYAGGLSQSQYAISNTDSRGFYGVTREPNAPNFYSILNTNSYSLTAAYVEPSVNINGLALSVDSSGVNEYTAREQAFACIANGLTLAEAQNLRLANLTFQTTLSRNV